MIFISCRRRRRRCCHSVCDCKVRVPWDGDPRLLHPNLAVAANETNKGHYVDGEIALYLSLTDTEPHLQGCRRQRKEYNERRHTSSANSWHENNLLSVRSNSGSWHPPYYPSTPPVFFLVFFFFWRLCFQATTSVFFHCVCAWACTGVRQGNLASQSTLQAG